MSINTFKNREFKLLLLLYLVIWTVLLVFTIIFAVDSSVFFFLIVATYLLVNVLTYLILERHYAQLRGITLKLEKISRGDFSSNEQNNDTGDLDILRFQLYQMTKRIENSIGTAQRDKELLKSTISGLSHQFKTPISVLRTFNDLLIEGAIEDTVVAKKFVEKSAVQLDKLERLVSMFLKLSRLDAGISIVNKSNNDLILTVQEIINSIGEKALMKQQTIYLEHSDRCVLTLYDPQWLFEAIYNILENAISYSQHNKDIHISVKQTETFSSIAIKDDGIGICEKDLPRVFERFYQGENASKNSTSTGIGLSLTKLIIEKHIGVINIVSGVGTGTTVTVILPN